MPRFQVSLTYSWIEGDEFDTVVEAENEEIAVEIAIEELDKNGFTFDNIDSTHVDPLDEEEEYAR